MGPNIQINGTKILQVMRQTNKHQNQQKSINLQSRPNGQHLSPHRGRHLNQRRNTRVQNRQSGQHLNQRNGQHLNHRKNGRHRNQQNGILIHQNQHLSQPKKRSHTKKMIHHHHLMETGMFQNRQIGQLLNQQRSIRRKKVLNPQNGQHPNLPIGLHLNQQKRKRSLQSQHNGQHLNHRKNGTLQSQQNGNQKHHNRQRSQQKRKKRKK